MHVNDLAWHANDTLNKLTVEIARRLHEDEIASLWRGYTVGCYVN